MPSLQAGSVPRRGQEGSEGMAGAVGNNHPSGVLWEVEEDKGHCSTGRGDTTSPKCKRGERWIQRWRSREREIDRETGRETGVENYTHMQRWSETDRTRDTEGKTKNRDKWIELYRAPPHSTQHEGQTQGSTPSRRASAVFHVLPMSAVELIILTEVQPYPSSQSATHSCNKL